MVLAPDVPYIYVPENNFIEIAKVAALGYFDQGIECSNLKNHCKFYKPCENVITKDSDTLNINLVDHPRYGMDPARTSISMKHKDLLVPGEQLGDSNDTCYLGVFKSSMSQKRFDDKFEKIVS